MMTNKAKNRNIMFQQHVNYKEEHGTLRFPSDEQYVATMNEEFIALHCIAMLSKGTGDDVLI